MVMFIVILVGIFLFTEVVYKLYVRIEDDRLVEENEKLKGQLERAEFNLQ